MEARVVALEGEIAGIKATLSSMEQGQATLIAMFKKSIGKRKEDGVVVVEGTPEKGVGEGSKPTSEGSRTNGNNDDTLLEFRQAVKKVELPMFDGEDPAGWISRAEVYFRVQGTRPEVKVSLSQLCMEGATIHFFNSLLNDDEELTWETLKAALLERYGGHGDGDVYEQLTELKQTGSVDEYITEFEYLTAQIPRLLDRQFLGYFLHGLKEEIRGRVRSMAVVTDLSHGKLLQATRAIEKETRKDRSGYQRSARPGHGSNRSGTYGPNRGSAADWVLVKGGKESTQKGGGFGPRSERPAQSDRRGEHRDRGFTHLSYNEIMERRRKGQCFKCKGPFSQTHQCPEKYLRVLIVDDDVAEGEEGGY
jgi:hypothetical protein